MKARFTFIGAELIVLLINAISIVCCYTWSSISWFNALVSLICTVIVFGLILHTFQTEWKKYSRAMHIYISDKVKGITRISWTYLHGKLDKDAGYDIFYVDNAPEGLCDGIHSLYYKGERCTLFLWTVGHQMGLCVYTSDDEAWSYAYKAFINKSPNL